VKPYGLAFTPGGDLVVVDDDGVLVLRDATSSERVELVARFGGRGSEEGMFLFPRGVCVAPDGCIIVADYGNCRVQILDSAGVFQRSFMQVISLYTCILIYIDLY
jgi:hypothetical protein